MLKSMLLATVAVAGLALGAGTALAEGPKVVSGPGYEPACFKPWTDQTKFFQWQKKEGPYRIALVNGYVGNDWRIQMVQTAKAYAEKEGFKEKIKEFKVVSTGTDVAAQLGAIEDFINQGYDAIVTIAVSTEGFDRVIRLADRDVACEAGDTIKLEKGRFELAPMQTLELFIITIRDASPSPPTDTAG